MTTTEKAFWSGVFNADDATHDQCYARYLPGCRWLVSYHFAVSEDLTEVRIVAPSDTTANGIWTLAEIRARGEGWRRVASVAARMRAAVARHRTHDSE